MTIEIIKESTILKDMNEVTSEQVLGWTKGIQAQRSQKVMLESLKEMNVFDMVEKTNQRPKQTI